MFSIGHAARTEHADAVVELELAVEDHLVAVETADRQLGDGHVDGLVVHARRDEDEVAGLRRRRRPPGSSPGPPAPRSSPRRAAGTAGRRVDDGRSRRGGERCDRRQHSDGDGDEIADSSRVTCRDSKRRTRQAVLGDDDRSDHADLGGAVDRAVVRVLAWLGEHVPVLVAGLEVGGHRPELEVRVGQEVVLVAPRLTHTTSVPGATSMRSGRNVLSIACTVTVWVGTDRRSPTVSVGPALSTA